MITLFSAAVLHILRNQL